VAFAHNKHQNICDGKSCWWSVKIL